MWEKNLAKAIIFQSIKDIRVYEYREECIEFFKGDGYKICAEIAGFSINRPHKILNFIGGYNAGAKKLSGEFEAGTY